MTNKVILLYGPPACGKYSVAKKLSEKSGAYLLDNHHFNNVIMPFTDINSQTLPDINKGIYKIRRAFFDVVAKHHKKEEQKDYIFTNVLLKSWADKKALRELQSFAKKQNYEFVPVELKCSTDVLLQRVDTQERKKRYKLTDANILKSFLSDTKFLDIKHKNKICVDVSNLSLDESLQEIEKRL